MEIKTVEEINQYIGTTVNPLDNPDTVYELYSVPSFESQHPEIIKGEDIGSSKITVEDGDVLVCKINPRINRVWVVKWHTSYPLLASSEWIVIRNCDIDSDYLKWYFSSPTFRNLLVSQVAGIGGSLTRAQPKQVAKYPVPLVGKEEQRRIATTLDKVSDLIAKRRAQLDKLDLLVKARFVEMFGTEHEFRRWPCGKVADVADVCVGVVIKPTQYYAEEGVRAFRSLNIGPMYVKDNDWIYFSQEGHLKNQKSVIHKDDVLVVRSGAPGTACVATEEYDGCNAVDIIIARPDTNKINPVFLAMFTNLPHGMNQIQERTGGAAQQHFNVGGYKALNIIMPPLDLQNEFASYFEQSSKSKLTIQQSLDKLEILKKALMQQYFG